MSEDFMNILQMVQAGKTPANVRTDIDDKPADRNAIVSAGDMAPRPKPWQKRPMPDAYEESPSAPERSYARNM